MDLAAVLAIAVVALGGAVVAAVLVARATEARLSGRAAAERDAAVQAAVAAVADHARGVLVAERAETLRAAVESATSIAGSRLGDALDAGERELDHRSKAFETQVAHIGEALAAVGSLVAELQKARAEDSGSLRTQLEQVATTQRHLAEHTEALRAALASPKQRGQWGERMAEDVLAAAGFKEGVQYRRQTSVEGGTIPDFSFLLPQDLELRMDVKFPVDNYLRHLEADSPRDAAAHAKAFVRDVRNRIRELAGRGYVDARDTVDCMLLFIPNEAVYGFLHDNDPDVIDVALEHKVVLCSPSSLFAVLAVVRRSVEQFRLERTSDEILRCLGGLTDEWDKLSGAIDKVGRAVETTQRAYGELEGTRRRQFQRRLDDIDRLRTAETGQGRVLGRGEALVAQKAAGDVRPLPLEPRDEHLGNDADEDVDAAG